MPALAERLPGTFEQSVLAGSDPAGPGGGRFIADYQEKPKPGASQTLLQRQWQDTSSWEALSRSAAVRDLLLLNRVAGESAVYGHDRPGDETRSVR
jgi:hypothetical protein